MKSSTLRWIIASVVLLFVLTGILFYLVIGVNTNTNHIKKIELISQCWDTVLDQAVLHAPLTGAEHTLLINEAIKCTKLH